jgi:NHLM bacteriocin system ABC transporter peptidase/ATP-binding protein
MLFGSVLRRTVKVSPSKAPVTTSPRRVKVPTLLQQAATECGAASLGMVLAHYGRWLRLDDLRDRLGVGRDGANAQAIVDGAQALGLQGKGRRVAPRKISGVSVPAIIWWKHRHFMVLEGASGGLVHVNDPARGPVSMLWEDFKSGYSGIVLEFERTDQFEQGGSPFSTRQSLAERLRPSRSGVWFVVLAGLLIMFLGLLAAPLSQTFVDDGLGSSVRGVLPGVIAAMLVVGLFRSGLTLLQYGVIARIQSKVSLVGSVGLTDRMLRLPMLFFMERSVGDLSQRVAYNSRVAMLIANQLASSAIALLAVAGYAALLIFYSLPIGVVVLGLTAVNVVILRAVSERRTTLQSRIIRQENDLRGLSQASIRNVETLKATGKEDDTFTNLADLQTDFVSASGQLVPSSAVLAAAPPAISALTTAAILFMGGREIMAGSMSFGSLLAIQALAVSLSHPVQQLMSAGSQLQVITTSLQALDDVLVNETAGRFNRTLSGQGSRTRPFTGRLDFDEVQFKYNERDPDLIDHLSFSLMPGSSTALVGVSGAGKTTIGNLAAGLLETTGGRVLFDSVPLSDFAEGVIENGLAKVDQDVVLFSGTIAENVTLWDPTVDREQISRALADAQVLDDVLLRNGGLDAIVEEDGRNFSGGQAQRIEIARAIVRQPSLLILDEATSALDDVTEARVMESIRRRGISSLIIAHRLSTIRDADEIIVLGRGGKVLERGRHVELMGMADGVYRRMVTEAGDGGDVGS